MVGGMSTNSAAGCFLVYPRDESLAVVWGGGWALARK